MKTTPLIVLGALGLVNVGCAATTTDDGESTESTESTESAGGETDEQSQALRIGAGPIPPDRDTCEAMRAGCTRSCMGNPSCIRNCNMSYEKCRGLPPISGDGIMALPPKPKPVPFCPEGEVRKCTLGPPPTWNIMCSS